MVIHIGEVAIGGIIIGIITGKNPIRVSREQQVGSTMPTKARLNAATMRVLAGKIPWCTLPAPRLRVFSRTREASEKCRLMMRLGKIGRLLLLLMLANGTPVLAKKILGTHFSYPVDTGTSGPDDQALFGTSKTVRGVLLSILFTSICALCLGLPFRTGALIGAGAMAGDLFSSFCKRRMHLPSSSKALGLDQVPESLFPLIVCRRALSLKAIDIFLIVAGFFVAELTLSQFLYKICLRDQPY
jgi:CDP-archaeol synthase